MPIEKAKLSRKSSQHFSMWHTRAVQDNVSWAYRQTEILLMVVSNARNKTGSWNVAIKALFYIDYSGSMPTSWKLVIRLIHCCDQYIWPVDIYSNRKEFCSGHLWIKVTLSPWGLPIPKVATLDSPIKLHTDTFS